MTATLADSNEKHALQLCDRTEVNHNFRKLRFKLPSDKHCLGLPVGQCIYLGAKVDGKTVIRPYTPITSDEDLGFCEIMVKVYYPGQHPSHPHGGKMSQHLENLKIGDSVEFRGCTGRIQYKKHGKFSVRCGKDLTECEKTYKHISMIAGGSGITPMLSVINDVLKRAPHTKIRLIFGNETEKDVCCKKELDELAKKHSDRFAVWYTVTKAPAHGWAYSTGYVNEEMIKNHLFPPSPDNVVLVCGPLEMVQNDSALLDQLEYNPMDRQIF